MSTLENNNLVNRETKENSNLPKVVCNIQLTSGDYVCLIDRSVHPPQIKPFSLSDKKFVEARLVLSTLLKPELEQVELTEADIIPLFREYTEETGGLDADAEEDTNSNPSEPATTNKIRIFDTKLSERAERQITATAMLPESSLIIVPQNVIRKFSRLPELAVLAQLTSSELLPQNTQLNNHIAAQQATGQIHINSQNKEVYLGDKPKSEFDQIYQLSEELKSLSKTEFLIPRQLLAEVKNRSFSLTAAEAIVRTIEQTERKVNTGSLRHRLQLDDVDTLSRIIDNPELIKKLRHDLITARLVGYLIHRLGGGVLEGSVTYGNIISGVPGDVLAILSVAGNISIEFWKEIQDEKIQESLQNSLEQIINQLKIDFAYEIKNALIEDLDTQDWASLPKNVAGAEMNYSATATLLPAVVAQTAAFASTGRLDWAGLYLGSVITAKMLEKVTNKGIIIGKNTRKAIHVLLKNIPEILFVGIEKRLPNNTLLQSAGLIVPLLAYTSARLLPQFEGKQTIDQGAADMDRLRTVLKNLGTYSLSLSHRDKQKQDALTKVATLEQQTFDIGQVKKRQQLVHTLSENEDGEKQPIPQSEPSYFDFSLVLSDKSQEQLSGARAEYLGSILQQVTDNFLLFQNNDVKREQFIEHILVRFLPEEKAADSTQRNEQIIDWIVGLRSEKSPQLQMKILEEIWLLSPITAQEQMLVTAKNLAISTATEKSSFSKITDYLNYINIKKMFLRVQKVLVTSKESPKEKPQLIKRYSVLNDFFGTDEVSGPAILAVNYDIAISDRVLAEATSVYTEPGKITFLKDASTVILKTLAEKIQHNNGTMYIRTPDQDINIHRDMGQDKLSYVEFNEQKVDEQQKYFPDYPTEIKSASDKEKIEQLFTLLQSSGLFSDQELQRYRSNRLANMPLKGEASRLRLKLWLYETFLSKGTVLILHKVPEKNLSTDDVLRIANFLQEQAKTKVIILSDNNAESPLKNKLGLMNASTSFTFNKGERKFAPAPPTESELIGILDKFKIPYSIDALHASTEKTQFVQESEVITAQEWCQLSGVPFQVTEKQPDDLLTEIINKESTLYHLTCSQLHKMVNADNTVVTINLPEKDDPRETLLRVTDVVKIELSYQPPTGEKLYLVEVAQYFNVAANDSAPSTRVFRERRNVIGITEKFTPNNPNKPESPTEAALRGLREELSFTVDSSQLTDNQLENTLKFSSSFQCPTMLRNETFKLALTPDQYQQISRNLVYAQKKKTSIFGFIPESKLAKYSAGETEKSDYIN